MNLKIVSIRQVEKEVSGVTRVDLNTTSGLIQVLPNHEKLITKLEIGLVSYATAEISESIIISGGFARIADGTVLILADEVDLPQNIIKEQIEQSIKNAEVQILQQELPPTELIQLEKRLMYEKFKYGYIKNM